MKGYYTGIVPGVTLHLDIEELPRKDQWALCHHLMQKIGITEAIYEHLFPAQRKTLDIAIPKLIDSFIEGGDAQKAKKV